MIDLRNRPVFFGALKYVAAVNGGATLGNFEEDHEPIGPTLWRDLLAMGLVELRGDRVHLTEKGQRALTVEDAP